MVTDNSQAYVDPPTGSPGKFSSQDPLSKFFEGGTAIYTASDIDEESDVPEEIKELIDIHGLSKVSYQCILKERHPETGQSSGENAILDSWRREIPSIRYIMLEYGPGRYDLTFLWYGTNPETGKRKGFSEKIPIVISDKCLDMHEDYLLEKRIKSAERKKQRIMKARVRSELEGNIFGSPAIVPEEKRQDVKSYVSEIAEVAGMLGLSKQQFDWQGILSLALPLLPGIMNAMAARSQAQQENFNKMMMLMVNQTNNSSQNLLELVRSSQTPTSGDEYMKKFGDMMIQAMEIKSMLSGDNEKESLADKIFKTIESVAGMIMPILMVPKQQRQQLPAYNAAQAYMEASPEFQQLKNDPSVLAQLVPKLDSYFGWQQTDLIIQEVGGYERPPECPRRPEQTFPANDPRNETVARQAAQQQQEPQEQNNNTEEVADPEGREYLRNISRNSDNDSMMQ